MLGVAGVALAGAFVAGAALGAAGLAMACKGRGRFFRRSAAWPEEPVAATPAPAASPGEDATGL